jgi:hypothetical protein
MYTKNSPKKIFFLGLDKHFFQFFLNLGSIFYNKMTLFTLDKPKIPYKLQFMNQNPANSPLQIIDVPPELRGMTDEEILLNSEKPKKTFSGKRKNGAARPAKKDRVANKHEKDLLEAKSIAAFIQNRSDMAHIPPITELPLEKQAMLNTAFSSNSKSLSVFKFTENTELATPHSMISEAPKPTTGRVLKVAFGIKGKDTPKAVIVSAADHEQQKAEERKKKIQALTPVKRGRGRPRKNPIV